MRESACTIQVRREDKGVVNRGIDEGSGHYREKCSGNQGIFWLPVRIIYVKMNKSKINAKFVEGKNGKRKEKR